MPSPRSRDNEHVLGYRLIELLGAGGFGEVWKAEAPGGLLKAIKFVYGKLTDRQASQELSAFEQIKQVRHPFVLSLERVEVFDGQLIMVSELADSTLLDRFEECRAEGGVGIPREELLRYLLDAAEALDFITSRFRLQHLDVKPSNLFIMGDRLKVGDFGLVREVCHHSGSSAGGLSPAYAPPESFKGEVSFYSDEYSLAIVYQEMLTGTRPFRGRTVLQLSDQHLHGRPNLASLSSGEQSVIGRALSKNPNERFPSCGEMVRALLSITAFDSPVQEQDESNELEPRGIAALEPLPSALGSLNGTDILPFTPGMVSVGTCASLDPDARERSGPRRVPSQELAGAFPSPTLFVGIGGIAGSVLCQIKHLFEHRSENRTAKRRLDWLLVDTDRATLEEARCPNLAGKLGVEETLLMPLHGPDYYRPQLKELLGWLARHWVFRIPRSHCTEGIRPLGRLALIDNADRVVERLRHAIRQMSARAQDHEGGELFRVVVIASISGGTGGGCFADLGLAIRQILKEERLERATLEGLMILASGMRKEQRELAQANAYVTLSELRYYLDPNCRVPSVKALGLNQAESGVSLFDQICLADFGDIISDEDIDTSSHLLAEHVYLRRGTPYGWTVDAHRPGSLGADKRLQLRSFRLARLGFPRGELRELVVREACRRIMSRWLHGMPRPADVETIPGPERTEECTASRRSSPEIDADRFFAELGVDEEKFREVFLERMAQVGGSDPLKSLQRQACDLLRVRENGAAGRDLARLFDEMDARLGLVSIKNQDPQASPVFVQKLKNAFAHDRRELERRLQGWAKQIVEDPAQRLKPARDGLNNLIEKLVEQLEATPARVASVRLRKVEIRERYLGNGSAPASGSRRGLSQLLRGSPRGVSPRADDLSGYGQLLIEEASLEARAEILGSLLAKASQVGEELIRLQQGVEYVERSFVAKTPRFRSSQCTTLGSSDDLLPVQTNSLTELRETLADSFCNDRRLANLERKFHAEVLEPHGGLSVVMTLEHCFLNEVFQHTLFERVACAVGEWLKKSDAASILCQWYGSTEGVVEKLILTGKSTLLAQPKDTQGRLIVGLPGSPSGKSLRESLAKSASELSISDCVSIPDDVVLCLEIEELSFASVLAGLASGQPWLTGLAPKLVSRQDVAWPELSRTAETGSLIEGGDDL